MHAPESVNYNIYASGGWDMHGSLFANTKNWLGNFFVIQTSIHCNSLHSLCHIKKNTAFPSGISP